MLSPVENFFGSALLGIILNAWVVGLICMHAFNYYSNFPNDKMVIKLLVAWTVTLQVFNLFIQAAMIYHYLVASWGISEDLLLSTWEWNLYLGMISIAACSVQVFYTFRIFILSRRNHLISIVILLLSFSGLGACFAVMILGMTSSKEFSQLTQFSWLILIWLCLEGACDLLIALFQVYYLHRNRGGLGRANRIIRISLLYIISTGLLTSILVVAELATFAVLGFTFSHVFLSYVMGGVHTFSLLATLDARRNFLAMDDGVLMYTPSIAQVPRPSVIQTMGQWEVGKNTQTTSSDSSPIKFLDLAYSKNGNKSDVSTMRNA